MAAKGRNIEAVYPLTPLQQGMLFHTLYAPGSGVYIEQFSCVFRGNFDVAAFEKAWQGVTARHAILRTAFSWDNLEEPLQVVGRRVVVRIEQMDWQHLDPGAQEAEFDDYLKRDRNRGFVTSRAPLMRLALFRIAPDAYRFLWTYHHLLLDGWSVPILIKELMEYYEAFRQRKEAKLGPARPYSHYIAWLQKQDLSEAEAFWRETLKGFTSPNRLAVDRAIDSYDPNHETFEELRSELSASTTAALQSVARELQVTLSTLVQGVWALLLSRYSDQHEAVFGVIVSGRPPSLAGADSMLGLFINTLPLRVQASPELPLPVYLKKVQGLQSRMRQYEYTPLVQIHGWSEIPRNTPLFESILVFENYPVSDALQEQEGESSVELTGVRVIEQTNYPITVGVLPGTQLQLLLGYSCQRFNLPVIKRMLGHFENVLEQVARNPERRLTDICILTESERYHLLVELSDTGREYPSEKCLHELFEAQAAETPDNVAAIFDREFLTYGGLDREANRLARYLQRLGVGPEVRVGIFLRRSLDMMVALIGISKAGGAYVPMDPAQPRERLAFTLEDAGVQTIVAHERLLERLPEHSSRIVCLDRDGDLIRQESEQKPVSPVAAENPVYVIYTSGSTGKPKGVAVKHRSLVNYISSMAEVLALAPTDRMLQFASLSFDASTVQFYPPLLRGAAVVLQRSPSELSNIDILDICEHQRITILDLPTAFLNQWIDDMVMSNAIIKAPIRLFMMGGENPSVERLRALSDLVSRPINILSSYGPTETTVATAVYTQSITKADELPPSRLPIGRLLPNTQMYLLNRWLEPVPIGVPGEVYIAGEGVARGYLNNAEATAERFIPNPMSAEQGSRLYRTGDVGRHLQDGNIEFLGRTDHQVKIRGYRIELGEIEEAMRSHERVKEAVVVVREEAGGEKQLVGYVRSEVGEEVEVEELREYLRGKVAEYMMPSVMMKLEQMPLTPNGKVDRKALPSPDLSRAALKQSYVAARTQTEQQMVVIWKKVLGLQEIGIDDNFFSLGGHSLLATQMVSRIRESFAVELGLRKLFETPTIRGLAEEVERVTAEHQQSRWPELRRVNRDQEMRLSYAQQRMWFLNQMEPESAAYNIPVMVRLSGELDERGLIWSLNEIVRRHEALRTRFASVEGRPVQVIESEQRVEMPIIDLEEIEEGRREEEMKRVGQVEGQRVFDLERGPVMRVVMVRLGAGERVVEVVMHHIVSDGWSAGVVVNEVVELYKEYTTGVERKLEELGIQYADYAAWQREKMEGGELEEQLKYWKEQLGGELGVVEVPTDRSRPVVQTYGGGRESFEVSKEVSERLKEVGQQEGVTIFMMLLAAYQTLLYRYTSQTDILIGTPVANRRHVAIEGLIGFFANTLVMRTNLSGAPSFRELLGHVKDMALSAFANQDVPFERLVEEIQPDRDLSRSPLFQIMFIFQNTPIGSFELPGLRLQLVEVDRGTSMFDLTLSAGEGSNGLSCVMEYNADLFDGSTIARMAQHYITLLEGICSNIDRPIFDLPLLTDSERHQLLHLFNSTAAPFSDQACIHDLVRDQVELRPEQTAVVFQDQEISYQELERRSNQVANYLIGRGVRPELRVGVCLERGIEMIVGVLGILKAGGAYVPLDPAYPADRLTYMIDDSDLSLLLAHQHLIELLPPSKAEVVCIDKDWQRISLTSPEYAGTGVRSHNLAYVIYTSGSTGKPKGVQIEHRSVVNFLETMMDKPGLSQGERLMAVTSLSFDIAGLELMLPLVVGAVVVMTSRQEGVDARELMKKMDESRSRVMQATPATWAMMMEGGWEGSAEMRVLCGGEALRWELGQELKRVSREVWSLYGPTETTIWSGIYEVRVGDRRVPIGKPIGNTQMYVMDGELGVVPIGAQGEVYIAGEGVARGYLNNAEATAERFIPNPMSAEQGSRLYRTGDVGRHLQDGNIEFLGRTDHQVKIRGYRIELGEIEEAMRSHERVKEAVVVVREEAGGEKQLVGYVRSEVGEEVEVEELREYLRGKVAEYMMPSVMMKLEQMPLTPNGKVDRKALPSPDLSRAALKQSYVAARTQTEQQMVVIWKKVLGLQEIGIDDNFFSLGGHSLLATQMVSRIRESFAVELGLRKLFETPTIRGLAEEVERVTAEHQQSRWPELRRVNRDQEMRLSYAQQRMWFLNQMEPESAAYNIPVMVRLSGELDERGLIWSLNEIVRRHEALRTRFASVEGRPVQVIESEQRVEMPIIDLEEIEEGRREEEMKRVGQVEGQRVFDLERGPVMRVVMVRLGAGERVVEVVMHHIVSDGWSAGVVVNEVVELYKEYTTGVERKLEELGIQYADYAAWQREKMEGGELEEQLKYWKEQLGGELGVVEVPTDRSRPVVQTYGGGRESFEVSKEVSERLKEVGQQEGVTIFMMLLAAYQTLLYRYTGREDIVIGSDIAGRNHAALEGLIGFFANMLVMRTDLSGDPDFREVLRRVRRVTLDAYANQDVPFERLVEELQPVRDTSRNPLFQVSFAMQNTPFQQAELPGLALSPVAAETETSRFDLTLTMAETLDGMGGSFVYSADLFYPETISLLAQHFVVLLGSIAESPEKSISSLPILTPAEEHQLLVERNDTATEVVTDRCAHHLLELQVERTPDEVAVVFGQEQLTYAQLNRRANKLARYIRSRGVRSEVTVGLYAERSLDMVVGLLGIMKAGGAYLPIDPQYPIERIAFMLEDSQTSVLLTQERLVDTLPVSYAQVICLDSDWEEIDRESGQNLESEVSPENLAYVIYTSGSTGSPKGVMLRHSSLCNLSKAQVEAFGAGAGSRVMQFSSLSFDASVWEIFMALLTGATICLRQGKDQLLEPELNEQGITIITLPPSMLATMSPEKLTGLDTIIAAGERCSEDIVKRFAKDHRFFNAYGPTEITVCASMKELTGSSGEKSSIGRAIANTQLYVLDRQMQLVPVGVGGELFIAGAGVARGYLNRPDLTADRFIPNAYATRAGDRVYRTGDVVRYLRSGDIEFIGRTDQQVKLRGYRIELAEIEAVLSREAGVTEAAVIVKQSQAQSKQLVAYVVGEGSWEELKRSLSEKVPDYMVPSKWVRVERMPLTPNGKVDRRALEEREGEEGIEERGEERARTQVEEILAGIWEKVLGVEKVGIHDNFFDLGGDSILSIQVIARATQVGVQLTPRQLFQHQTIAELATVAGMDSTVEAEQGIVTGTAPFTPIQHWFFDQGLPEPQYYNQAVLFNVSEKPDAELLEKVVANLLLHHDALRLRFPSAAGERHQIIVNPTQQTPFTLIDLSEIPEDEQPGAIEEAAGGVRASLDITHGPIIRVAFFDPGPGRQGRLLLVIHHLAVDGFSWRVILEDFQTAYLQLSQGQQVTLPPKTSSFIKWSRRLAEYAQGQELQTELDYWLSKDRLAAGALPVDSAGPNSLESARVVNVSLDAQATRALLESVPSAYHTQINEVLLTALAQTLSQWKGSPVMLVDLEGHGRDGLFEDVDLSRTVGWFTSLYPVVLSLRGAAGPGEALKSIKEQVRAVPNKGIGYGILRYLNSDSQMVEKLQSFPRPDVTFNYLGRLDQVLPESSPLTPAGESAEQTRSVKGDRTHVLEINSAISGGQLGMEWTYSANLHRRETIEELANRFINSLKSLIEHCQSPDAGSYTPSDFPDEDLTQEELDQILGQISNTSEVSQ